MNYREYVAELEPKEILQLIEDYQKFEKDGSIGPSMLRVKVEEIIKVIHGSNAFLFPLVAQLLMFEVYRLAMFTHMKMLDDLYAIINMTQLAEAKPASKFYN